MVGEFPELQGQVGRLLAELEGAPARAALAIEESWLPRGGGGDLPTTPEGRAFALADRAVLLGLAFADEGLGLVPRGNADPQGIRRAAGGLVAIHHGAPAVDVRRVFEAAGFALDAGPGTLRSFDGTALLEFVLARFRAQELAEGHSPDIVEAVMAAGGGELRVMAERIEAVTLLVREGGFEPVRTTFRRVAGLARDHDSTAFDPGLFASSAEAELAEGARRLLPEGAPDLLAGIVALRPLVDHFFAAVLVMTDDAALRANRLGLLRSILVRVSRYADFSRLSADAAG
jgi:glycyl-tRNA synthetase beta chain